MLRGLSLCTGIGGLELGLNEWVEPKLLVEINPFCSEILALRFPTIPQAKDVYTLNGKDYLGSIDIVVAGFPCQPFSTASRGRKVTPDLWPEIYRIIQESSSPLAFLENVLAKPIYRAARDLHTSGYRGAVAKVSSTQVGAPHDRQRWWLLAYANNAQQSILPLNAEVARVQEIAAAWQEIPSKLLGMDDGLPYRMDRLHALGNSVVPQQANLAFRILMSELYKQR